MPAILEQIVGEDERRPIDGLFARVGARTRGLIHAPSAADRLKRKIRFIRRPKVFQRTRVSAAESMGRRESIIQLTNTQLCFRAPTISLRHFVEKKKKMKDRLESLTVQRRKFITTPRCNRPASRCFFEETGDA